LNVTGEKRWEEESTRLKTELRTILSRPEPYRALREAATSDDTDPVLRRQAVLLANEHAPNQISQEKIQAIASLEDALMGRFTTYRAELDGEQVSDNDIREILDSSDDVALRQRAWEASVQIGAEVADELVELVRMRNAGARELGYRDYYSMAFGLDE